MQKLLWCLILLPVALFMGGATCNNSAVVRDAKVYQTELNFWEQASLQTADSLAGFIAKGCSCVEGKFTTEDCEKAAKKVQVVRVRVPYHKAMALYNAGLLEERPPAEPPVVPPATDLCPTAVVAAPVAVPEVPPAGAPAPTPEVAPAVVPNVKPE